MTRYRLFAVYAVIGLVLIGLCSCSFFGFGSTKVTETVADPTTGEAIADFDDNIPFEEKVGLAQERKHPMCEGRTHSRVVPMRSEGDFDFIIVGGGSAGNVVASRLAESDPTITVLLIESGKNPIDDSEQMSNTMSQLLKMEYCVPGQTADKCPLLSLPLHLSETPFASLYPSLTNDSYYYTTTPQLYANKREIHYPRGNLLGGSSATNNLVAFRAHPEDFDRWASLGLPGWSYNDVLPFLKRIETNHDYTNTSVHGVNGPIHISNSSSFFNFPVANALIDAAVNKLGYPHVEDFNKGYANYGAGHWQQYSNDKGRRTSSYEYIRRLMRANRVCLDGVIPNVEYNQTVEELKVPKNPSAKHPRSQRPCTAQQNLHIITSTFVSRIIFDNENNNNNNSSNNSTRRVPRAIGVEFANHTSFPYKAVRFFPKGSSSDEEVKSRMVLSNWKKDQRAEVLNCPVDETLAFDYDRQSEWYIPPDSHVNTAADRTEKNFTQVFAKREVILTAGAVNSAQLLMLSGIGPQPHLEHQLGFKPDEVVMDLPVGSRVLDHEEIATNFKLPSSAQHWGILKDLLGETNKWVEGKPSAIGSNHIPGGMDISSEGVNGSSPTIHIHFIMLYMEDLDQNQWRNGGAATRPPVGPTDFLFYEGLSHYTALIERSGSCSQGTIRCKNRDPFTAPFVDLNYGSCKFTNDELVFGIKEVRRLNSLLPEAMRGEEVLPGKEVDTDEKLVAYVRNVVWGHHISGSVPMGKCDDELAVLDNKGRVYGVEGLRVADASVFPTIPHGNILYSVYTVAERISDFIIRDHGLKGSQTKSALNP